MAGLNHDFFLVNRSEFDYWDYAKFINQADAVLIHDDILAYIADSLMWIPCHNPAYGMKKGLLPHNGFNFYGPTIIKEDGASNLFRVFDAWALLFLNGSQRLELTAYYESIDQGAIESHKIVANRDDVVESFQKVANFGKHVAEGFHDAYVLHLGI